MVRDNLLAQLSQPRIWTLRKVSRASSRARLRVTGQITPADGSGCKERAVTAVLCWCRCVPADEVQAGERRQRRPDDGMRS